MDENKQAEEKVQQHAAGESSNGKLDVEAARAVLREANEQRVRACAEEVQAVLKKHDCRISAHFIVHPPNKIEPVIDFIANNPR